SLHVPRLFDVLLEGCPA
ncbi:hypothetical protein CBR_g64983, partial [Chara braunii]